MTRVSIRGVIVGSEYDSEWTKAWIENGMLTPLSAFERQLNAVKDDDVDIYINTRGGDVFAGYEMVNAIRNWQDETGKVATVTVGAMAASMGAYIAVMAGGKFRAHSNAKLMIHGATCEMWGGAEAMKDESGLLGKINDELRSALVARYTLAPEVVDGWFAEGRQGWLTAEEAQAAGMVSEIIGSPSEVIDFDNTAVAAMQERGLKIAAFLTTTTPPEPEDKNERDETDDAGATDETPDGDESAKTAVDAAYEEGHDAGVIEGAETPNAELTAQIAQLTADHADAIAELTDKLTAAETDNQTKADEITASAAALATAQAETADHKGRLSKLLHGFAGSTNGEDNENGANQAALKRHQDNLPAGTAEYAAGLKLQKK